MKCTIELLLNAASVVYGINLAVSDVFSTKFEPAKKKEYENMSGYKCRQQLHPGKVHALCFLPDDNKEPIVISFRGTKDLDLSDLLSDVVVAYKGVGTAEQRHAAYEYYQKQLKDYPEREFILTGHSLGGNLAQYVATRACYDANDKQLAAPLLSVRTFNSAPCKTRYGSIYKTKPELKNKIINYRTSNDVVSSSKIPLKSSYGDTYIFQSKTSSPITAHGITALREFMPPDVLKHKVSQDSTSLLIEQINGMFSSYKCRIDGRWFLPRLRFGAKNLAIFENNRDALQSCLLKGQYPEAKDIIDVMFKNTKGRVSSRILQQIQSSIDKLPPKEEEEPSSTTLCRM